MEIFFRVQEWVKFSGGERLLRLWGGWREGLSLRVRRIFIGLEWMVFMGGEGF